MVVELCDCTAVPTTRLGHDAITDLEPRVCEGRCCHRVELGAILERTSGRERERGGGRPIISVFTLKLPLIRESECTLSLSYMRARGATCVGVGVVSLTMQDDIRDTAWNKTSAELRTCKQEDGGVSSLVIVVGGGGGGNGIPTVAIVIGAKLFRTVRLTQLCLRGQLFTPRYLVNGVPRGKAGRQLTSTRGLMEGG
jgi:hypothetical protein